MNAGDDIAQQLEQSRAAAEGEPDARRWVSNMIHPVIEYQTNRFCPRFCQLNRYQYRCSLNPPVNQAADKGAALCEWGNASYGWMLDDLTSTRRLQNYQARNQASLFDYLYQIANSLPFYERWKDWRFGRRINVPEYIKSIAPRADKIFYALREGLDVAMIASRLNMEQDTAEQLIHRIVAELVRRKRLYLLDTPREHSLSRDNQDDSETPQADLPFNDDTGERLHRLELLQSAWGSLDTVEQFVLEALVLDELDAKSVLHALAAMDVSIKQDVAAEATTVQQLYYFKRKTLAKMAAQLAVDPNVEL